MSDKKPYKTESSKPKVIEAVSKFVDIPHIKLNIDKSDSNCNANSIDEELLAN